MGSKQENEATAAGSYRRRSRDSVDAETVLEPIPGPLEVLRFSGRTEPQRRFWIGS